MSTSEVDPTHVAHPDNVVVDPTRVFALPLIFAGIALLLVSGCASFYIPGIESVSAAFSTPADVVGGVISVGVLVILTLLVGLWGVTACIVGVLMRCP